ncbi:hypothetical protein KCU89_g4748, partial [Aureobasidium melanogenum]
MGAIANLLPLVILFVFVGAFAFVGYQMYLWTNDLANHGKKTMEKKNVMFTKDGMKVGVKEMSEEEYADRTQRCVFFTSNLARDISTPQHHLSDPLSLLLTGSCG